MDKGNVVHRAEDEMDERTAPAAGERKYASEDTVRALRKEQQDEAAQAWVGPGVPGMTDGQWRGLVGGSLVGGAIGALFFLPLALVPFMEGAWLRVLLCVVVGALAGGTAGALYQGGREPELEGETLDGDGRGSVGTTLRDSATDPRGR